MQFAVKKAIRETQSLITTTKITYFESKNYTYINMGPASITYLIKIRIFKIGLPEAKLFLNTQKTYRRIEYLLIMRSRS